MYLFLDNTAPAELIIYVSNDESSFREYRKPAEGDGNILKALEEILKIEKAEVSDLLGIAVRVGLGRFTATRVAVVFANTMAYALHIPVCTVHDANPTDAFRSLLSAPKDKYLTAEYSAEPRIGPRRSASEN